MTGWIQGAPNFIRTKLFFRGNPSQFLPEIFVLLGSPSKKMGSLMIPCDPPLKMLIVFMANVSGDEDTQKKSVPGKKIR